MSIEAIMTQAATRSAANITGLKATYSSDYSSVVGAPQTLPTSIPKGPVGIVMAGGGRAESGNWESEVHDLEVQVWIGAAEMSSAYKTLMTFPALFKAEFHTSMGNAGTADRVLYRGYDGPVYNDDFGKPFLVLSIRLEATELNLTNTSTI